MLVSNQKLQIEFHIQDEVVLDVWFCDNTEKWKQILFETISFNLIVKEVETSGVMNRLPFDRSIYFFAINIFFEDNHFLNGIYKSHYSLKKLLAILPTISQLKTEKIKKLRYDLQSLYLITEIHEFKRNNFFQEDKQEFLTQYENTDFFISSVGMHYIEDIKEEKYFSYSQHYLKIIKKELEEVNKYNDYITKSMIFIVCFIFQLIGCYFLLFHSNQISLFLLSVITLINKSILYTYFQWSKYYYYTNYCRVKLGMIKNIFYSIFFILLIIEILLFLVKVNFSVIAIILFLIIILFHIYFLYKEFSLVTFIPASNQSEIISKVIERRNEQTNSYGIFLFILPFFYGLFFFLFFSSLL